MGQTVHACKTLNKSEEDREPLSGPGSLQRKVIQYNYSLQNDTRSFAYSALTSLLLWTDEAYVYWHASTKRGE
jgi:hypothetical protein